MVPSTTTELTALLHRLVRSLKPFTKRKNISLLVAATDHKIVLGSPTCELYAGLEKLLRSIFNCTPYNSSIALSTSLAPETDAQNLFIKIKITGINLKIVTAIIKYSALSVRLFSAGRNETTFEVCYTSHQTGNLKPSNSPAGFNYIEVQKGIRSHFAKLIEPMAGFAEVRQKKSTFLSNLNKCILANIDNEQFNANALSDAMAMSRAQLLRRLKSLTGDSPGSYIRSLRLDRAKQFLETSDLTVSEAAFRTGFSNPSHFTKVFNEKYGIAPSKFRKDHINATNVATIATNAIGRGV